MIGGVWCLEKSSWRRSFPLQRESLDLDNRERALRASDPPDCQLMCPRNSTPGTSVFDPLPGRGEIIRTHEKSNGLG